jgi:hypothetical protein
MPAITTALNYPLVVVGPDHLVKCCAWCLSAKQLADLHLAHRCSDGLCPDCAIRFLQETA